MRAPHGRINRVCRDFGDNRQTFARRQTPRGLD
jgi:hypothetical protein